MTTNILTVDDYDEQADINPDEKSVITKNACFAYDGQEMLEKVKPARLRGSAFEGALKKVACPSPTPLFEVVDGELLVDPDQLEVNRPEVIEFEGAQIMIKKSPDGNVEFYTVDV